MNKKFGNGFIALLLLVGAAFSTNPRPVENCTAIGCGKNSCAAFPPDFRPSSTSAATGPGEATTSPEPAGQQEPHESDATDLLPGPRPAVIDDNDSNRDVSIVATRPTNHYVTTAAAPVPSSPRLNLILPRGIQRGQAHTVEFIGERLGDAQEVFFYSAGFQVANIEKVDDNRIKAQITVNADVPLGEHIAQVRTATGISDYRSIWVNSLPAVNEVEPNNELSTPQVIALNQVIQGVCDNEDVDYYQVECKKDQRLNVEVAAMRLGSFLFDPYIAVLDANRFEIAVSDDSAYGAQDGICSVKIPEDGKYTIAIRESSFGGNGNCRYQLYVGTFPRPTAIFPAGGKLGETLKVQFLGDALGTFENEVVLPAESKRNFQIFPEDEGGIAPTGHSFRLGDYENAYEAEPNQGFDQATTVAFPAAFNGIIQQPDDADFYKFTAKKGQVWDVEVFSRRIRSGLDPVINIWKADRSHIVGNDDSRGPDSYIRFEVPEDGEYFIRVRDHLGRGQDDFVYRIEFQPVQPQLSFGIPRVEQYGQYRQTIAIPRGGRFATQILGNRANFGGELVMSPEGLPEGVSMHAKPMAANLNLAPVVFEAAADAPIGGKLIKFRGRHIENEAIAGVFENSADFVLGQPNQSKYVTGEVDQLAVAIVEKLPFTIEIVQPMSPIVQNGTKSIVVKVNRDEGFQGNIHVEFPFRTPGIGTRGNIQIPPDKTEGEYPLNANGNAQVGKWPIYAIGMSDVGGPAWTSTQLAELEVAQPYVTMEMPRVGCEQGQNALVSCKLNHIIPFEGEATAQLFGLPPHCEVEVKTFNKDTEEIVFEIKTKPETNAGKHRGVFCQVNIPVNGETVTSRAGEFEFQVDTPLPKEQPKPEAPKEEPKAETPPPQPPAEKPLSRLEKLRQQAKEASGG